MQHVTVSRRGRIATVRFETQGLRTAPLAERRWRCRPYPAHRQPGRSGPARVKRLVILAEKIGSGRAAEWGAADEVVPDGTAFNAATALAERAAALPPVALRICKQDIDAHATALARVASHSDCDQYALAQSGEDYAEGVRAFIEKRAPRWTGG